MRSFNRSIFILLSLVPLLFTSSVSNSTNISQTVSTSYQNKSAERYITIDFDNVDIRLFIKYISELTEKNFIIDKAVQGNITIVSPTKISEEEAYRVFESVLEVNGYTTVPSGAVIKVIPSAKARSQNVRTLRTSVTSYPEDKVITQIIPLKYTLPEEMKKVLIPLVSKTSLVIAHQHSKMLIITETLSNIQRLSAIIEALDVEYTNEELVVIPLDNADAVTISDILNTVYLKNNNKKNPIGSDIIKVVPYERVNSLVVLASKEEFIRIKKLVALLDTPAQRGEGNIHVFYLQNANATELAKVLNEIPLNSEEEPEKGNPPSISHDVKIMADDETNSLIIMASREEYTVLEEVINKLDIPRQMVYLEALIMEVNTSRQFDVGVEWVAGGLFDDGQGVVVSGFSGNSDSPFGSLGGIDGESPSLQEGFSLGVLKKGIEIGGVNFPSIAAILHAYQNDSDINIIATPQILTTDNKKAEISVGENVPYITSKNTTASEQDYTQYEYKDVATKLSITPQINQADTMRLDITTEIVKLKGNSQNLTPTTFKRTASTSVILNDQDTVVIGGIIGQDATLSENKIPLLGDIPFIGWLFKTRTTETKKTNMFIFITPKIIRNPADILRVTDEKEADVDGTLPGVKDELKIKLDKNHANILLDKGYEKLQEDKTEQAGEYFTEALENDPNNPFALLNLGIVAEHQGNLENALDYYRQVIALGTKALTGFTSQSGTEEKPLAEIARENIERIHANIETKTP